MLRLKCLIHTSILLFFSGTVLGNTIHVDEVAMGMNDGSDWTNAFTKLRDGLAVASTGDTVLVAQGTYFPDEGMGVQDNHRTETFNIPSGVVVLGGFPTGGGSRDPSTHVTVLSGEIGNLADTADNSYHVVTLIDVDKDTQIDGFTIEKGNADGAAAGQKDGGGIYHLAAMVSDTSMPVIANCIIQNNFAETRGGGMYSGAESNGATSFALLVDCEFILNNCSFDGGAFFNHGLVGEGISSFTGCQFTQNTANAAGAVHNLATQSGSFKSYFSNCLFTGNMASSNGGGIHNVLFEGSGQVVIDQTDFMNNSTTDGNGGALYAATNVLAAELTQTIDECDFIGNSAGGSFGAGGAIELYALLGKLTSDLNGCDFSQNTAIFGGAVCGVSEDNGAENEPTFTNCLFEENKATDVGGGVAIFCIDGSITPVLTQCHFNKDSTTFISGALDIFLDNDGTCHSTVLNCLFTDNYADETGGAVTIDSFESDGNFRTVIHNSIFSNNQNPLGSAGGLNFTSPGGTISHSLIDAANCNDLGIVTCGSNMFFNVDPQFVDPSNGDYHLAMGAPIIDQGLNDSVTAIGLTEDYDGNPRIVNSIVDIGIYESIPPPANDECTDAITLIVSDFDNCDNKESGTLLGATDSQIAPGCGFNVGDFDDDVWYKFVATQSSQVVEVSSIAGSTQDLSFEVLDDCSGTTSLRCHRSASGGFTKFAPGVFTIGNTYYIRVASFDGGLQTTTFDICVRDSVPDPPANNLCNSAVLLTASADETCNSSSGTMLGATTDVGSPFCGGTNNRDAWYSFVAQTTSHIILLSNISGGPLTGLQVFSGACGSLSELACKTDFTDGELVVGGLSIGTTYFVRVLENFINPVTFDICVKGAPSGCDLLVTTTAAVGPGSLRAAVDCSTAGDTIRFDAAVHNSTIALAVPQIVIPHPLVFLSDIGDDVTLGNSDINNTQVLISIQSNLEIAGLKLDGQTDASLILKIEPGGGFELTDAEFVKGTIDR